MPRVVRIAGLVALVLLIWLLWAVGWPFYGFVAHRGAAPMLPFGWETIEDDVPRTSSVHDPAYAAAGAEVIESMAAHRALINAPGMTAAVLVRGSIVWDGQVGWADIAGGRALTPETAMRIGSTSKALTATALARLVDEGVIDLEQPITDYLDNEHPPQWEKITSRMLASHMAGIPHYGDNDDPQRLASVIMRRHYGNMRDALDQIDEATLRFEPGTSFEYSSLGTVLLGAVMSEAAGTRYRDLIREEVLEPAGAGRTFVAPKRTPRGEDVAVPYYEKDGRFRPWRPVDLSHRLPGGGWASTSRDLVRIGALWLRDDFIAEETRRTFWTPQRLASGEVNEQDYALGWRLRAWEVDGAPVARNANHGGVSRGGQSWLLVYPELDMVIAFNMNGRTEDFSPFGSFHHTIYAPFANAAVAERSGVDG